MGWKSTMDITREEAIRLIMNRALSAHSLTDHELADMLEFMGYGDNQELPYYGYNFYVTDGKTENK